VSDRACRGAQTDGQTGEAERTGVRSNVMQGGAGANFGLYLLARFQPAPNRTGGGFGLPWVAF